MSEKRDYYTDTGQRPFLFYVVFGATGEDLQVSRTRHHVDAFPEGLSLQGLSRKEHGDYLDGFFTGSLGEILKAADEPLYERCRAAETCVVLRGQVREDASFAYMRNAIGFVQALLDQGASGVLDLLTFSLYSPEAWADKFLGKEISACRHVVILVSEEEEGLWLHTRGMLAFGRPDLSLRGADRETAPLLKEILDQMILYSGRGVLFKGTYTLHTEGGEAWRVRADLVEDYDNDDFNNAWCEISVLGRADG